MDHPRGCGEHIDKVDTAHEDGGSSPRMRGTLLVYRGDPSGARIIPADAGNTLDADGLHVTQGDHPRGCGEHIALDYQDIDEQGSSPRMRGTRLLSDSLCPSLRIIPADAGNTCPIRAAVRRDRDHPRGCGEHPLGLTSAMTTSGSSPRMRGTQRIQCLIELGERIIPADAGNTRLQGWGPPSRRDHPRGCGEHRCWTAPLLRSRGSSPRMRGTPWISEHST